MTPTPRYVALTCIKDIIEQKQTVKGVLYQKSNYKELSEQDKAFCHNLVAASLRFGIGFDKILSSYAKVDDKPYVRYLFWLSFTQIFIFKTPIYAVVNEMVELCKSVPSIKKYAALVNGVLRNISRESISTDEIFSQMAAKDFLPTWLQESWSIYGKDFAKYSLCEAPLDLYYFENDNKFVREETFIRPEKIVGFDKGDFQIQDLGASLPIHLLNNLKGKIVYDLCSAPGGTTIQAAKYGANVIAIDKSSSRLRTMVSNLKRMNLEDKVTIINKNALDFSPEDKADIVIIDAPCSATGTIRRHPEILHIRKKNDVDTLVITQKKLLNHGKSLVKSGGELVYITCSLEKEECENQVEEFISNNSDFVVIPFDNNELKKLAINEKIITRKGYLRATPAYEMDGIFAVRLKKV